MSDDPQTISPGELARGIIQVLDAAPVVRFFTPGDFPLLRLTTAEVDALRHILDWYANGSRPKPTDLNSGGRVK